MVYKLRVIYRALLMSRLMEYEEKYGTILNW